MNKATSSNVELTSPSIEHKRKNDESIPQKLRANIIQVGKNLKLGEHLDMHQTAKKKI